MVRSIVLAGLVVLLPLGLLSNAAKAQRHAGMASGGHVMAAAPRATAHPVQPVGGARVAPRGTVVHSGTRPNTAVIRNRTGVRRNFNTSDRFRSQQCRSGVPGLGFDEAHLAAICPNGVGTGFFGGGVPFYTPFLGGGDYMPGGPYADDSAAADAQEQDNGDVDARDYYGYGRRVREAPASQVIAADQTPINDSDQYIFVRRDGTVFFAVAYSWEDGTLRYVTSDGLRRNIAKTALDLDATQQFNEQRGLTFHLPA